MAHPENMATYPEQHLMGPVAAQLRTRKSRSLVVGGSIIMLLSTILVSCLNFGYNTAMARMLGPAKFGHVAVANTILMLVSAISLAFQMVCAKFVARSEARHEKAGIYRSLLG